MKDKIKIPTEQDRRIDSLEVENAELWFENITVKSDLEATKQEVADLWYVSLAGGVM